MSQVLWFSTTYTLINCGSFDFSAPPVGHLTLKSAHIAGNLIKHLKKSQMPVCPGGGGGGVGMITFGIDPDTRDMCAQGTVSG